MPATSEKNLGRGKKKVISLRKNNHYLYPNLRHTSETYIAAVTLYTIPMYWSNNKI